MNCTLQVVVEIFKLQNIIQYDAIIGKPRLIESLHCTSVWSKQKSYIQLITAKVSKLVHLCLFVYKVSI